MGRDKKEKEISNKNASPSGMGGADIFQEVAMLLLTVLVSAMAARFYGKSDAEASAISILACAGFGCVLFSLGRSREEGSFLYDNGKHLWRFTLVYLFCLSGSILLPLAPVDSWPYLAVFVGLALFSNQIVGFTAGITLLMVTGSLKGGESSVFFLYMVSGLVGIMVFSYINETFKIWAPVFISLLLSTVCLLMQELLIFGKELAPATFIVPAISLLADFILLMILLKFLNATVYRNRDRYMDINDPEHPLLVRLMECSKEEYYHAIHTAYLCDRIAQKVHLNEAVVKACGYYHRIGMLKGENTWENAREILQEYHMPNEVLNTLREYLDEDEKIISREGAVLFFCDTVISSISYLFSKDPKVELNYKEIISAIINKKIESGIIDQSDLTFGELQEVKNILVEERSYYDFLR